MYHHTYKFSKSWIFYLNHGSERIQLVKTQGRLPRTRARQSYTNGVASR